MKIQSVDFR